LKRRERERERKKICSHMDHQWIVPLHN
jgi:hypothetical protein